MLKVYSAAITAFALISAGVALESTAQRNRLKNQLADAQANNRVLLSIVVDAIGSK